SRPVVAVPPAIDDGVARTSSVSIIGRNDLPRRIEPPPRPVAGPPDRSGVTGAVGAGSSMRDRPARGPGLSPNPAHRPFLPRARPAAAAGIHQDIGMA